MEIEPTKKEDEEPQPEVIQLSKNLQQLADMIKTLTEIDPNKLKNTKEYYIQFFLENPELFRPAQLILGRLIAPKSSGKKYRDKASSGGLKDPKKPRKDLITEILEQKLEPDFPNENHIRGFFEDRYVVEYPKTVKRAEEGMKLIWRDFTRSLLKELLEKNEIHPLEGVEDFKKLAFVKIMCEAAYIEKIGQIKLSKLIFSTCSMSKLKEILEASPELKNKLKEHLEKKPKDEERFLKYPNRCLLMEEKVQVNDEIVRKLLGKRYEEHDGKTLLELVDSPSEKQIQELKKASLESLFGRQSIWKISQIDKSLGKFKEEFLGVAQGGEEASQLQGESKKQK